MPSTLFTLAAAATAANPLIGTWVADAASFGTHPVAQPTMTISREAISFGSGTGRGRREVGVAPISAFEPQTGGTLLVRTRLGDVYRFRFTGNDRMCSVADVAAGRAGAAHAACFSRSRGKV